MKIILSFSVLLALAFSHGVVAGNLPADFRLTQTEMVFYPKGSIQPMATCKVDGVFLDHRRLGFFHVRLLPILVVQGVHIELGDAGADDDWMSELGENLAVGMKLSAVEWRELDLTTSRTNSPHLYARTVRLMDGKGSVRCHLENCVIETCGQQWHCASADWQTINNHQQLAWRAEDGAPMHWDFSTGEISGNNRN